MRSAVLLCMLGVLLCGCADRGPYLVAPEYRDKPLACSKLRVHFPRDEVAWVSPGTGPEGGEGVSPREALHDVLRQQLPAVLQRNTTCTSFEVLPDRLPGLVSAQVPFGNGQTARMLLPGRSVPPGPPGTVTLFLERLRLHISGDMLLLSAVYALWDDAARRSIAHGLVNLAVAPLVFEASARAATTELVHEIVRGTPIGVYRLEPDQPVPK